MSSATAIRLSLEIDGSLVSVTYSVDLCNTDSGLHGLEVPASSLLGLSCASCSALCA